ncbi:MAG: hypothetical protein JSS71_04070 [Armatimonadetes bacterium]|nr:hypothetical protein [Armatimonadota bacterium]MBX3108561.1 hypothetical protein [Fimbriimonadaceae bacterium]
MIALMERHAVVSAYVEGGWDQVLATVTDLPLPEAIQGLNKLMIHFRWEEKDLTGVIRACEMAERFAGDSADPEVLAGLKAVCFNRAAFCWRGWGDSDVTVSPEMERDAARYAERNIELARRLGKTGVPLGRAEWLVGAFDWASGDAETAAERFDRAAELTAEGDDPLEVVMGRAYAAAARGQDPADLLAQLDAAENGSFYSGQVRSAMQVYGTSAD